MLAAQRSSSSTTWCEAASPAATRSAERRGISLSTAGEPGLRVVGDAEQLETAVTNLVQNAIAYSEPGARVAVTTRAAGPTTVEIRVSDNGIGISEADQRRIFERFYRVDARPQSRERRHRVWGCPSSSTSRSTRRRGDRCGAGSARARPSPSRCRASQEGGHIVTRVLIIEDEETYRETLGYMLRKEGFDVVEAADGAAGLAAFDRQGADIVLLDLMMPGLSGTEVCRQLRARGQRADHHGDRPGHRDRQGRGPGARRRRLRHQAVQPPRAGRPDPGGAAPRSGRRAAARRGRGGRRADGRRAPRGLGRRRGRCSWR